jgi:hypothetical protein
MATSRTEHELIDALAGEVSEGIHCGVNFWITQIDDVFQGKGLTTLGRLQRIREVVEEYRRSEEDRATAIDARR